MLLVARERGVEEGGQTGASHGMREGGGGGREEFREGGVVGDISHCCKFINYYSSSLVVIDTVLMSPMSQSHLLLQRITCITLV